MLLIPRPWARALVGAVAAASCAALVAQPTAGPPVAAVRNVPETFHGTLVDDPYRYFEDTKSPEVASWMKAHNDSARATLARIEGRSALRLRLGELDAATTAFVTNVVRLPGEIYFYERRGAQEDQLKLYMRRGLQGKEQLVFDPETLRKRTGKPHAVNYFSPSPDGRRVAVGVSAAGSEDASMRILDVATGRQIGPEVSRVQFGAVSWTPDGREIYFHRMQALKPDAAPTDKYQRSSAMVMQPGAPASSAKAVLTAGSDLGIPATEFPVISVLPDGRVLATVMDGVSSDVAAWHTTLALLRSGKPQWTLLARREDRVTDIVIKGDEVFALTFRDAPRYQVVGGPLAGFNPSKAAVVVPASDRVIAGLSGAADGLYVAMREGNVKRLFKRAWGAEGKLDPVELPVVGNFNVVPADLRLPGLVVDLQGWTRARQIVSVAAGGQVANTGLQPAGPHDMPADVVSTEVMVKSHDGAMVPMSIVHRRGVKLDGNNPLLMWGYASYGMTEEPWFSLNRLAWMERGGVFAVANPRGSGVFGKDWHNAGKEATKPNSWKDFIACAEWLVGQGWTRPGRLAIWGGSAGGLLVGRAMTERPDLFAAVVPSVGALDMVRAETTPNGVPNIPEFGTRATEAGFKALLEMSTYHQIRDNTPYPAVLFTHGVNDPRVEVWNTTKTAARLMAATSSGNPVLVRLDYEAGHGIGDTKSQILDEVADVYSFVLWQMGVPGFDLK